MDWIRYANVAMSSAATWMFVLYLLRRWHVISQPERAINLSFCAVLVSLGYGSAEALKQEVPFAFRVALTAASLASLCGSLYVEWRAHARQNRTP